MNTTKYWLWLSMVFGAGSRRIWEAMCLFETPEEAYQTLVSETDKFNLNEKERTNIKNTDIRMASVFLEECAKQGIGVVDYSSPDYPQQLRHIFNPPAILYYKGNISCLNGKRTITAVGTRNASDYGISAAARICRELALNGFVIVSGFALGTDITAHLAAVNANCPTVCVLGCGVDVNYPKGNFAYRDLILESGGVFISEYPPGTPPHGHNFPMRNRILAALGYAAIVFEASKKSGSMITASLACEQGREVFCLPPADIFSVSYSGNAELIRNGAVPLLSSADIMEYFKIGSVIDEEIRSETDTGISEFGVTKLARTDENPAVKAALEFAEKSAGKKRKNNKQKEKSSDAVNENPDKNVLAEELTDIQTKIAELLKDCNLHTDVILQKLDIEPSALMTELTELEILGVVRSLPGKMFELINKG